MSTGSNNAKWNKALGQAHIPPRRYARDSDIVSYTSTSGRVNACKNFKVHGLSCFYHEGCPRPACAWLVKVLVA